MTCKREQFEFLERESRTKFNDKVTDEMFNDLLARVKEYAQQRRLEEIMKKAKGDPMDIGQLHGTHHDYDTHWQQHRQFINEAYPYDAYQDNYLDALGKGKGKFSKGGYGKATGKGANAQCYVCGETGHLSYDCPKNKGKVKQTLTCWTCGGQGHPHWMCPMTKGKSKGKGKP